MKHAGGKIWFTAAELADLALPGLPKSKRKINEDHVPGWALRIDASGVPLARPRQARGGGLEYHIDVLPIAARTALAARGVSIVAEVHAAPPATMTTRWSWYDGLGAVAKAEAERRASIIAQIDAHEGAGLSRSAAVALVSGTAGKSAATLWSWLSLVSGIKAIDRLPYLAPRHAGGGAKAEIDDTLWQILKSDYLRPEQPTFTSCYYRARAKAQAMGLALPTERTLRRRLEAEVDRRVVISRREGADALRQTLPPQQRTVEDLHAMELVNIDGHKWDVFVRFPDGTVERPVMVAIQDIYSRKFLAHSTGKTESAIETRAAFAQLIQRYGVPNGCLMDNGRAFASKWITGGALSRFRFSIRDEEPLGLLPALGVKIHWALPFRGSSKPIERMFRDFCDAIAKHPEFAGAYTGNRPDAKPENYRSKAIPLAKFMEVVEAGFAAHNARVGRRTEMGAGIRSLDQVFADSYAAHPIGRATPEQLRLALLAADDRPTDRNNGSISLHGNRYWSDDLAQIAGQRVTVRFDPDDLHAPIHVYHRDGQYICSAPAIDATGFLDVEAAKVRARQEANLKKAVKVLTHAEQLLDASIVADLLADGAAPLEDEVIAPGVVRPARFRGQTAGDARAVAKRAERARKEATDSAVLDRMASGLRSLKAVS